MEKTERYSKGKNKSNKDFIRKHVVQIGDNEIELTERVVKMRRVTKVVKGGRRFSFNALTVVGDGERYVGLGFGKAKEIPEAIRKSIEDAKRNIIVVKKQASTIPHQVVGKFKSARVMLKPCAPGTGIIAGAAVRAVVELAGIKDILTKVHGSTNSLNITKATIEGLRSLISLQDVSKRRQLTIPEVCGEFSFERRKNKKNNQQQVLDEISDVTDSEESTQKQIEDISLSHQKVEDVDNSTTDKKDI